MIVTSSRNGASGSRVGVNSKSRPAFTGANRFFLTPSAVLPADPCTMSMHTSRIFDDPAEVLAHAVPAGSIASRNGNATVTPIPFRTVRRETCFFVMYMLAPYLTGAAPRTPARSLAGAPWPRSASSRSAAVVVMASAMLIWNAGLLTTPSTNDENLLPPTAAFFTIARIVGWPWYSIRRRRRRRSEQRFHDPLAALHRRRTIRYGGLHQDAALTQNAAPLVGHRHAAELAADDVRDPVDLGDAFVDERVVRRQQVEHVPIFADDAVEEQLRLALVGFGELVVEPRKQQRVGVQFLDVLQPEPLRREARRQRVGFRIAEHATHLLLQHGRLVQRAAVGDFDELSVRHRVPQEERQPRREIEIAQPIGLPRPHVRRFRFEPEEEFGARQDCLQRRLDARFEVVPLASLGVELHERLDVLAVGRTPVGFARKVLDDLACAGNFVAARCCSRRP